MVIDGQIDQDSSSWSPFNMRQYNLSILKPPVSKSSGSSESSSNTSKASSMSYTSAAKSLDILRQNLQLTINEDIKMVIAKYMDGFFKPGIENIKNNLGPDAVTDDHISHFIRTILEEAKRMYPVYSSSSSPSSCNTNSAIDPNDSDYQNSQQNSDGVKLPLTSPSFGIKRESDDTDSEASSMSNASKKLKKSTNSKSGTAKNTNNNNNNSNNATSSTNNNNNNTNNNNNNSTPSANASPTNNKPKKVSGPSRKHVAQWDADKLTPETLFIMGAKANKALGFAQTRGRLYVKHPGLYKYASDADDKEWLSRNKLMPATGGRAYIMLLDDIEKLATDNKLNVTINYEDIKGFRVPDFILTKMKSYINTWKKQYAEEAQRASTTNRGRNNNQHQSNSVNNTNNHGGAKPLMDPTTANTNNNITNNNNTLTTLNPPLLPPLPSMQQHQPQQHPPPPPLPPPQSHPSLNNYHLGGNPPPLPPNNVMYEPSLMPLGAGPQQHELTDMREYIHMEKPPPMYPGHQQQPQQQHTMPPMQNPNNGGYMHSNHMDLQLHEALTKGDWSTVSDRSLLQYALQGSRNMVHDSWNPQDSFDFINENTNGSLAGSGNIGDNSTLMQMSSDGTHLNAPNNILGQVQSPQNCELSAVLDQAFQYTAT